MKSPNIYLSGFMGVGKSTIGKLLAQELEISFLDLDHAIENKAGLSIPEIFKKEGEVGFRKIESEALNDFSKLSPQVISLGGGALLSLKNRSLIFKTGKLIYLKAQMDTLISRVTAEQKAKHKLRPLLQNKTGEELRQFMIELFEKRESIYEMASLKIETDTLSPAEVVKKVLEYL